MPKINSRRRSNKKLYNGGFKSLERELRRCPECHVTEGTPHKKWCSVTKKIRKGR